MSATSSRSASESWITTPARATPADVSVILLVFLKSDVVMPHGDSRQPIGHLLDPSTSRHHSANGSRVFWSSSSCGQDKSPPSWCLCFMSVGLNLLLGLNLNFIKSPWWLILRQHAWCSMCLIFIPKVTCPWWVGSFWMQVWPLNWSKFGLNRQCECHNVSLFYRDDLQDY